MKKITIIPFFLIGSFLALYERTGYVILVVLAITMFMLALSMIFGLAFQTLKNAVSEGEKDSTYKFPHIIRGIIVGVLAYLIIALVSFQYLQIQYKNQGKEVVQALADFKSQKGRYPNDLSDYSSNIRGGAENLFMFVLQRNGTEFSIYKSKGKLFFFSAEETYTVYKSSTDSWESLKRAAIVVSE